MKSLATLLLAFGLMAPLAAQQPAPPAAVNRFPLDRIVGIVGTTPIMWSDIQEVFQQRQAAGLALPPDSAGQMKLAWQILNELTDEEVLLQRASADTGIIVADADLTNSVEEQIKQLRARFNNNDQQFINVLKGSGFGSQEEYRRWLMEQTRRREMQQRYVAKMQREGRMITVAVSDADVTEAYEREKGSFPKRPPAVTFRQVVVTTTASEKARAAAQAKAESLLAQIRAGADFEQVAKRESMDSTTRELGGDLGWNRREKMVPEFATVMFRLAPGQMGPVTATQYGFHIIKVDRVKPSEVRARHILIKPKYDSLDITRAQALADSVLGLWKSGVPYDTLVKKFHDSDELEGSLEPFPKSQLPESYAKAFEGKKNGDFIEPFAIHDPQRGVPKFVVAQLTEVTEAGDYTLAELRDRIRGQLQQERSFRRLIETLKKETYVWVNLESAAGLKAP